jgi:hypothetical protein
MFLDPRVLHIDSLAKYAAAFFKISFSTLSRLFSASSSEVGLGG